MRPISAVYKLSSLYWPDHLVSPVEMGFYYLTQGQVLCMAQGIPENIIDEIRQHTDLVALVEDYLKLERRGKNMVGL